MRVLRENLIPVHDSRLITDFRRSVSIDLSATSEDIDDLGHMNNAVYVNWLDQAHLVHTFSLGITADVMKSTGCALVVRYTELTYFAALRMNEVARVGTCITKCDGKLRVQRQFQMVCQENGLTLLRGKIDYICIDFKKGKPRRMPTVFSDALTSNIFVPERNL